MLKKIAPFVLALSLSSMASANLKQPEKGGQQCHPDGQCVIFEVSIQMDSAVDRPVVVNSPVIYLDDSNSYQTTVLRKGDVCTKQVKVPWSVYQSIASIMSTLDGSQGEPPPAFTPAQQTMLLFYTTLMQQTLSFNCAAGDINR
ncbi:MAG: hypothetical protein FJY29_05890 [Betaproteobacteria bacterium]|nr:hypothetical protein [Betaproteobacteria bacterium]